MKFLLSTMIWLIIMAFVFLVLDMPFGVYSLMLIVILYLLVGYIQLFILIYRQFKIHSSPHYSYANLELSSLYQSEKVQLLHQEVISHGYESYGVVELRFGQISSQMSVYFNPSNHSFFYIYPELHKNVTFCFVKYISEQHSLLLHKAVFIPPFMIDELEKYYAFTENSQMKNCEFKFLVTIFEKKADQFDYIDLNHSPNQFLTQMAEQESLRAKILTEKGYLSPEIDSDGYQRLTLKGTYKMFKSQAFLFNIMGQQKAHNRFKQFFDA